MKRYNVRITFQDRREGPGTGRSIAVEASSVPRAVSKAVREFWVGLNRKQRFDAANTLKFEMQRTTINPEPKEVKKMLDRLIDESLIGRYAKR